MGNYDSIEAPSAAMKVGAKNWTGSIKDNGALPVIHARHEKSIKRHLSTQLV